MSGLRFHPDGSLPPPDQGWVFVFGSNLAGRHGGGAASAARQYFGAEMGVGEGLRGASYAIPTLGRQHQQLPLLDVQAAVTRFLNHARVYDDTKFFVTRIGCGIAGYADAEIAPMFARATPNCSFAEPWRDFLDDGNRSAA